MKHIILNASSTSRVYRTKSMTTVMVLAISMAETGCTTADKLVDTVKNAGLEVVQVFKGPSSEKRTGSAQSTSASAPKGRGNAPANESLVGEIQTKLKKLGYSTEPTGEFDAKTEAAIQDFQLDHDLSIDGKPSQSLLRMINAQL